ncbi:ABC transporter permease [Fulvivirga sediminis]|uniref:ABC transporter permease n=1 Tax=Fulvivirga sediminis TaxID=2803949 RepID=A0A937F6K1_9BACT|nr:ABC transporter permease [Fulvivirga sediminis]MBL3657362.1 ABC transporter permease [Fulvivirga sediminis]
MLKNYIKVAFRSIVKQRTFSLINIIGLAFGLTCAILISLWVRDELAYDQFHENHDRLYLTVSEINIGGEISYWNATPFAVGPLLAEKMSDVEKTSRISSEVVRLFTHGEKKVKPSGIYVDSTFLHMFSFPLVEGDVNTALDDPYSVVLSKKYAESLFGDISAINKVVEMTERDSIIQYKVTGVLEDLPKQSSLEFDFLLPFEPQSSFSDSDWYNYNETLLVMLRKGADRYKVDQQIRDFMKEYTKEEDGDDYTRLHLYSLNDYHLKSDMSAGVEKATGKIEYVRMFTIVALVIVLIAVMNFMNLSTAKSGLRAKEVGIRKTSGAKRSMLIFQFLSESVIITLISAVLAVTLADVCLPLFNQLVDKQLTIPYTDPLFLLVILGLSLLVGILAGSYPAFYISGFQPVTILKGANHKSKSFGGIRRMLVVLQFALSIALISGTIIIYEQIQFVMNKDLGIARDNLVQQPLYKATFHRESYLNEVRALPGVASVAAADQNPLNITSTSWGVSWPGRQDEEAQFHVVQTDEDFLKTFNLDLVVGSNFTAAPNDDKIQYIVNEAAIRAMGLTDPIGEEITVWEAKAPIVGVVKDFHHQSLFQKIEPVILRLKRDATYRAYIRLTGEHTSETLGEIKGIFEKYDQSYPFTYSFLDSDLSQNYDQVTTAGKLANIFAIVAIFISCLGLFGLTAYMTEQRTKETGVRKVFGASVLSLTSMFSKDFLKLVFISFIIAIPSAYYFINRWLEEFAYRIDLNAIPFLIAGIIAVLIALFTVSYNTIKAAVANPINSLRQE